MNLKQRQQYLKNLLSQIAPEEQFEEAVPGLEAFDSPAGDLDAAPEEVEIANEALGQLQRGEELDEEHAFMLEAIIMPKQRPVIDVVNDSYARPGSPFEHLDDAEPRSRIEAAIPSIGRIELPGHPTMPFGGTGFVVGDGLLMTNRHVAEIFAQGLGLEDVSFRPGHEAAIDFKRERDSTTSQQIRVAQILMIHPFWDMALLRVEGLGASATPLQLSTAEPGDLNGREVAVIGYPAFDPRNNTELQNRIFRSTYNIKRFQPGMLREVTDIVSFGHYVDALTHDSSTLGGNSGSAVVDVQTGMVVALHFAGLYLKANYAVPSHELARDGRVIDAGVNFQAGAQPGSIGWTGYWTKADPAQEQSPAETGSVAVTSTPERKLAPDGSATWTIPLEVTVRIGSQQPAHASATASADDATEKMVEPLMSDDYDSKQGYREDFLGLTVPMPTVLDTDVLSKIDGGDHELRYEHFSVVNHKHRRLALFTASNIDGRPAKKKPEAGKDYTRNGLSGLRESDREKWFTDPRIPALHQLSDKFFNKDRTNFDKGHIVRRDDVAWGDTYEEVRRANGDTYHITNCSPQVKGFNRSGLGGTWGKLENLVLKQAKTERYCVFAGPVFGPDDPLFHGVNDEGEVEVRIPKRYWKLIVARNGDDLESYAFLLDQDLSDVTLEFAVSDQWKSHMVSVPELQDIVGLVRFPDAIHDSDQADEAPGESVRSNSGLERLKPPG